MALPQNSLETFALEETNSFSLSILTYVSDRLLIYTKKKKSKIIKYLFLLSLKSILEVTILFTHVIVLPYLGSFRVFDSSAKNCGFAQLDILFKKLLRARSVVDL